MAENAPFHHGAMPIKAQSSTYRTVMSLFKWGALGVADLLILLVLWFSFGAGFVPAVVVAVIVLAAGVFGLRGRKAESR